MNSNTQVQTPLTESMAAECAELSYKTILDKIDGREDAHECLYYAAVLNVARVLTLNGHLDQKAAIHNLKTFVDDLGLVMKVHFSKSDSKKLN